jgi:RNA polymerase sigma-70 factor (ECF subfamily)
VTQERRPETAASKGSLSPGDLDRFHACVLPYLDAAHNLARYLLRDAHEAEDAVQDAFLRAIRHFDGFRGVDGRAWLLAIVRNTCLTRLRGRRSGADNVEFDEEIHTVEGSAPGSEADLARMAVREGLERLPVEFREALVLRELEGLSYKEIAQVSGVPIGTVMSRLARGRKQLMLALQQTAPKESG